MTRIHQKTRQLCDYCFSNQKLLPWRSWSISIPACPTPSIWANFLYCLVILNLVACIGSDDHVVGVPVYVVVVDILALRVNALLCFIDLRNYSQEYCMNRLFFMHSQPARGFRSLHPSCTSCFNTSDARRHFPIYTSPWDCYWETQCVHSLLNNVSHCNHYRE